MASKLFKFNIHVSKRIREKIIGSFKSRSYGRLSILSNLRFKIDRKFLVSANCFRPRPKVLSMVIRFKPKKMKFNIKDILNLEEITKYFSQIGEK